MVLGSRAAANTHRLMRFPWRLFLYQVLVGALFVLLIPEALAQSVTQIGGYRLIVPLPLIPGVTAPSTIAEYVRFIFIWGLAVTGIAGAIGVAVGGVRYLLAAGSPAKAQDAKDQIFHALLGILVVLASWIILTTINPDLTRFGNFQLAQPQLGVGSGITSSVGSQGWGRCFRTGDLGGSTGRCSLLDREQGGWGDASSSAVCNSGGGCAANETCCQCFRGEGLCDIPMYSCVNPRDLSVSYANCGPYLTSDCRGTMGPACTAGQECRRGDLCERAIEGGAEDELEIQNPPPPTGGITVVPVGPGALTIAVRIPAQMPFIRITVLDPQGRPAPAIREGSQSQSTAEYTSPPQNPPNVEWFWSAVWNPGIPSSARPTDVYTIVARGCRRSQCAPADIMGEVRRPIALRAPMPVIRLCDAPDDASLLRAILDPRGPCPQLTVSRCSPTRWRVPPTGQLVLDGSQTLSPADAQIESYTWGEHFGDRVAFIGYGPRVAAVLPAPPQHTVQLVVGDQYGTVASSSAVLAGSCQ